MRSSSVTRGYLFRFDCDGSENIVVSIRISDSGAICRRFVIWYSLSLLKSSCLAWFLTGAEIGLRVLVSRRWLISVMYTDVDSACVNNSYVFFRNFADTLCFLGTDTLCFPSVCDNGVVM